jgi:hypothetical protein
MAGVAVAAGAGEDEEEVEDTETQNGCRLIEPEDGSAGV